MLQLKMARHRARMRANSLGAPAAGGAGEQQEAGRVDGTDGQGLSSAADTKALAAKEEENKVMLVEAAGTVLPTGCRPGGGRRGYDTVGPTSLPLGLRRLEEACGRQAIGCCFHR